MKNCGRNIEDMEARRLMGEGIGTPATRAGIIETLIAKSYIQRVGKAIYATPKGIELIQLIENETLKSPGLTGEWEKKRSKIQSGDYDPDVFISEIVSMVREVISCLFPELELKPDTYSLDSGTMDQNGGSNKKEKLAAKETILLSITKPDDRKAHGKEIVLSIIKAKNI